VAVLLRSTLVGEVEARRFHCIAYVFSTYAMLLFCLIMPALFALPSFAFAMNSIVVSGSVAADAG
jgi:hypothetical protein